jgi:hypothetical protein
MIRFYRFMTGATQYRIEAPSREEAIRIAFEELQPNDDTKAVILRTLYDEEEAKRFAESAPKRKPHLRLAD